MGPPEVRQKADGTKSVLVKSVLDPQFDLLRFRRALHMVVLNTVAYRHGAGGALHPKYDPVREYIRRPQRSEAWPFAVTHRVGTIKREVCIDLYRPNEYGFVAKIRIFNHDFYIELLNTVRVEEWIKAECLAKAEYVGPEAMYPASPRTATAPPLKQYRLRVTD
jgi:hypothetical protein